MKKRIERFAREHPAFIIAVFGISITTLLTLSLTQFFTIPTNKAHRDLVGKTLTLEYKYDTYQYDIKVVVTDVTEASLFAFVRINGILIIQKPENFVYTGFAFRNIINWSDGQGGGEAWDLGANPKIKEEWNNTPIYMDRIENVKVNP